MNNGKLIITVAPTGPLTTKANNPNFAQTPEEIANTVYESYLAGAAVAHIHARDEEGKPTARLDVFREIIERIRAKCDINIQVSTGVGLDVPIEDRIKLLELRPTMASLNVASMTFANGVFLNPPWMVEEMINRMNELHIQPELEVYDVGHIELALEYYRRGLLKPPLQWSFVLGVRGGISSSIKNLMTLLDYLPEGSYWQVITIGRHQLAMSMVAMAIGGNVRVGMEDNVYYAKGVLAKNDAQFVERVVRLARELGREIATPEDVRQMLNLRRD